MEDVANGQEPCKIPLYANAPSTAVSKLRDSFEYVTDWILPDGLVDSLSDASEDASAYACNCEDAPCTNTTIDCSCVVDYGVCDQAFSALSYRELLICPAGYFYESGTPARLRLDSLPSHHTIYECCSQCSCRVSSTCRNDITQRGVQIKCSVRWTGEREFGLFAEEDIPKGAFLCCYIGEIISTAEARRRFESQMKSEQSNYILILREETNVKGRRQILKTSIDASVKGNISHFLSKTKAGPTKRRIFWADCGLLVRPCMPASGDSCGTPSQDRRHPYPPALFLQRSRYQSRRRADLGLWRRRRGDLALWKDINRRRGSRRKSRQDTLHLRQPAVSTQGGKHRI